MLLFMKKVNFKSLFKGVACGFFLILFISCRTTRKEPIQPKPITEPLQAQIEEIPEKEKLNFDWPVSDILMTSFFGWRTRSRMHEGIDMTGKTGTPIYASETGQVIHSGWLRGYGYTIILKHHDEWSTLYAHLSKLLVKRGEEVGRGQEIGKMGRSGRSTATHLHFEIRKGADPLDPLLFLPQMYLIPDPERPKYYVPSKFGQTLP